MSVCILPAGDWNWLVCNGERMPSLTRCWEQEAFVCTRGGISAKIVDSCMCAVGEGEND